MNPLLVPPVIALIGGLAAAGASAAERAELGQRFAVAALVAAGMAGVLILAVAGPGNHVAALAFTPLGIGAGVVAAAGAALALSRHPPKSSIDVSGALAVLGVAGGFLAAEARFVVPLLLYLLVPLAAMTAARWRRGPLLLLAAVGSVLVVVGLGGTRQANGGWTLPWLTGAAVAGGRPVAWAAVGLAGALVLSATGCLLGMTADGTGDGPGSAAGWPLVTVGTALGVGLAAVIGPAGAGAPPGAILVLALAAGAALLGAEAAPFSAAALTVGVALAPGCGPGTAALVGMGAFAGALLERAGIEALVRYGRWSRTGLPGGAAFPGVAVAVVAVARSTAPGGARAVVVALILAAALASLLAPARDPSGPGLGGAFAVVGVGVGAVWLAFWPGPFLRQVAVPTARLLSGPEPAISFGWSLAAMAAVAVGLGALASLANRPVARATRTAPQPEWRRRVGVALERVPRPSVPIEWAAAAVLVVVVVLILRLTAVGARVGFL